MSKTGPKPVAPEVRFWRKVNKLGPIPDHCPELGACWEWTGSRLPKGYGKFGVTSNRLTLAHRFAWELEHGEARDMHVLHHCDNPACCRVNHMFLGTNRDNIADRVDKGRSQAGEKHWTHRHPERVRRGIRLSPESRAKMSAAKRGSSSWIRGLSLNDPRVSRIAESNRSRAAEDRADEVLQRYASGDSVLAISTTIGCGWRIVARLLRQHGVHVRSISEQKRIHDKRQTAE